VTDATTPAAPLRALRRAIGLLPRGRARATHWLARRLRHPLVDTIPPYELGLRFVIDPADLFQAEIWTGAYQPHVISFLLKTVRPGDRVLCAGLHVGYIVAIARRLAGSTGVVLTAEPDASARAVARRNLALCARASDAPLHLLEAGLSDIAAELQLNKSQTLGHSSFGSPHHLERTVTAAVQRGDQWLQSIGVDGLDVMVLDVEGWEVRALEGLRQTITRSRRLQALVEANEWALIDAGSSLTQLVSWWHDSGFDVRWAQMVDRKAPHGVTGPVAAGDGPPAASDLLCTRRKVADCSVAF
jgi:FkbM family methyltransferase